MGQSTSGPLFKRREMKSLLLIHSGHASSCQRLARSDNELTTNGLWSRASGEDRRRSLVLGCLEADSQMGSQGYGGRHLAYVDPLLGTHAGPSQTRVPPCSARQTGIAPWCAPAVTGAAAPTVPNAIRPRALPALPPPERTYNPGVGRRQVGRRCTSVRCGAWPELPASSLLGHNQASVQAPFSRDLVRLVPVGGVDQPSSSRTFSTTPPTPSRSPP